MSKDPKTFLLFVFPLWATLSHSLCCEGIDNTGIWQTKLQSQTMAPRALELKGERKLVEV